MMDSGFSLRCGEMYRRMIGIFEAAISDPPVYTESHVSFPVQIE